MELINEKQEIRAYIDVIKSGLENSERRFAVPLHQQMCVQNLQPGLVTARDYYNPDEKTEQLFQMDSCHLYWKSSTGGSTNDSTEKLVNITTVSPVNESPKEEQIVQHMRILRPQVMYSFNYFNQLASWNTTLDVSRTCRCNMLEMVDIFGIFGTNISYGDLSVDLVGYDVVNFDTIVRAAAKFKRALEFKMDDLGEVDRKHWCYGHNALFALIKKLAAKNHNFFSKQ
ncbi:hypothetical protein ACTXT7_001045 [Hymenolepis weldensis]